MLDKKTIELVQSTIPLLEEGGIEVTKYFYNRMFKYNPELKDIFNLSNQESDRQREALFNAIFGYAVHLENLAVLGPVVEKIAQKHTSFRVTAEQYSIVGENFLATLREFVGVNEEVIDAWALAYQQLANIFIVREEELYQQTENLPGGWRDKRKFELLEKTVESDLITSFVLKPIDGKEVVTFKPGQYIGIWLRSEELEFQEIRQYSLSDKPNGETYRISVKREGEGKVSNFLHDKVDIGDVLDIVPPAGDFFFNSPKEKSVVLLSAGVGVTPVLSMLETIKDEHTGSIHWLHATQKVSHHSFKDLIEERVAIMDNLKAYTWYEHVDNPESLADNTIIGNMNLDDVTDINWLNTDFYFCGPVGFMQFVGKQLIAKGVDASSINYECFGPHKVLD
ncbi:NO-inducible flavohemoprotein [Agarivorans sp. B2Z047]|uniref:NO-inducible flavohemoprotein n=1 Tax=Agarivorans sp. B2Z047 TaxID=2652721 RepID=UPI00128B1E4E|nr:NO-inducible flavohemoprotein [Agarivorans sp. B2Z047]MPW31848.1 NO-inducible flavohemoprotein [Agarivorans sp. B2Z047]UQN43694.1 NO-inducible flavohemoprotein [Agarivorans sp. B2Z047]